jgi:FkbM family methyltransferase
MEDNFKVGLLRLAQEGLIVTVRPYVRRELPGWGKIFGLVASHRQSWLWEKSRPRTIRGKLHGRVMRLDLTHWADRAAFFLGRWYDLPTQLFTLDFVRPGDTVVDVGANQGMFALIAQHAAGDGGRIICFEPNPVPADVLQQALVTNGITNVTLHRAGLSDAQAELTLSVPRVNSGEATFGHTAYAGNAVYTVRAPVLRGDDALADATPRLVKIDVEGFEYRVLRGLEGTLRRCHPVVITEIVPAHLQRCGTCVETLTGLMTGLGYRGFRLDCRRRGHRFDWTLSHFPAGHASFDAAWLPAGLPARDASLLAAHGASA